MTAARTTPAGSAPWHLWAIGGISLLWNAMGAFDYLMTQTRNAAYLSGFSPEQLAFWEAFPAWLVAAWAIAVWGGVLGSLLLLLRSSLAVWAFLASLIAVVLTTLRNYVLVDGLGVVGDAFSLMITGLVLLIALALYLYARTMKRWGVLRRPGPRLQSGSPAHQRERGEPEPDQQRRRTERIRHRA